MKSPPIWRVSTASEFRTDAHIPILHLPVQFRWTSYVPLAVLHVLLLLRLLGDLASLPTLRLWGSLGNATVAGLFLLNMVFGFSFPPKSNSIR